uniref:Uncharacterized protein n=1 Tax=Daucus carota subsp. sativus TaxID=79200 RepID=A0A166EQH5_DAUCS
MDSSHASILKSAASAGQPSGQMLHSTAGGMSPQVQARNQQLPGSAPDIKTEMNPILNPRTAGPEGSLMGIPGSNQSGSNLTLKGWPLTGLDQLRSGLIQQQKSFMQGSQPFHQLQMLTPQHQQQLMLAQQNLTSPSSNDVESRRLRMLLNSRSMSMGKDGLSNSVGDVVPNVGSPLQHPTLPRGDPDMLLKNGRKRKQPASSSGPANSTGTANTAGPSPGSAPSTPSTHTPGDVISMPPLQHNGSSSKPLMMFGTDGPSSLASPSTQLWDDKDLVPADMDRFVEDGSLDDNVESFLSHNDTDPIDAVGRCMDAVLWHADSLKPKSTLEEHTALITDVRFSPSMSRLATSSFDKTVRVWDAENGGTTQMRFQPRQGRLLAAAAENVVSILDVETQACRHTLQGGKSKRSCRGTTAVQQHCKPISVSPHKAVLARRFLF